MPASPASNPLAAIALAPRPRPLAPPEQRQHEEQEYDAQEDQRDREPAAVALRPPLVRPVELLHRCVDPGLRLLGAGAQLRDHARRCRPSSRRSMSPLCFRIGVICVVGDRSRSASVSTGSSPRPTSSRGPRCPAGLPGATNRIAPLSTSFRPDAPGPAQPIAVILDRIALRIGHGRHHQLPLGVALQRLELGGQRRLGRRAAGRSPRPPRSR